MDWTAIISGAAAGALVSAVGTVIAAVLNNKAQKDIAGLNHQHEVALQTLDDRRRLRDAKAERLRHNLEILTDAAVEQHTQVIYFMKNPDIEYKDVPEHAATLNKMLIGVRGKILVDADCADMLDDLNDAYIRYQALGQTWADYRNAQETHQARAAEMGHEARLEMGKLLSDLKDLIEKPRAILERYEQPVT